MDTAGSTPQPPATSPAPSPAKAGRGGRKTGRGGSRKKNNRIIAAQKRAATRARGGRGGRNRFSDTWANAANGRQCDMKEVWSELVGYVKDATDELANREIQSLVDDPDRHKKCPEYIELQRQLDERYAARIRAIDRENDLRVSMEKKQFEDNKRLTQRQFIDSINYANENFDKGNLNRVNLLASHYHNGGPIHMTEARFVYELPPGDFEQGISPHIREEGNRRFKVPNPHLLGETKKAALPKGVPGRKSKVTLPAPAKRRMEEEPEGQPEPKKSAIGTRASQSQKSSLKGEAGDDNNIPAPRHIGGLLSAEHDANANADEVESNAPSPGATPVPGQRFAADEHDLPALPNGASDPDSRGVRTVTKRGPKANNRMIIRPLFEFGEDEIGFRDSTNDQTRKATRALQGSFLNKPNSRHWHLDPTILSINCLTYEKGDLDPKLVKKHNLHEKYGLFLHDSINESEPPEEEIPSRPIVFITENGEVHHASRTFRNKLMDEALDVEEKLDEKRSKFGSMITAFCQAEDIDMDDIMTEEMRERDRKAAAKAAVLPIPNEEISAVVPGVQPVSEADEQSFAQSIDMLIQAAETSERPEDNPEAGNSGAQAAAQRSSRPYDAVRDVFGASDSAPSLPPQSLPTATPVSLEIPDTSRLSHLADLAELHESGYSHDAEQRQFRQGPPGADAYEQYPPRDQQQDRRGPPAVDDPMIDPRLLGQSSQASAPSNVFLQTALNPTPNYPPLAPAPSHGAEPPAPSYRNPFSGQADVRSSPQLPPLRPLQRAKRSVPELQPAHEWDSHRMQPQEGSYYPQAPVHPYPPQYVSHEQHHMMPAHAQPEPMGINAPGMVPNPHAPLQPHGAHMMAGYPAMSPPMHNPAQLAHLPIQMGPGHGGPQLPPSAPPGSSIMDPSTPSITPRPRNSLPGPSSAGGNQNSSKFRKIAAAPIPHNRPWTGSGGPELRLAHYDFKEAIKDYRANEPPPRTGPTMIRGWNVNNQSKNRNRGSIKKEDSEEKESPSSISPYMTRWSSAEQDV